MYASSDEVSYQRLSVKHAARSLGDRDGAGCSAPTWYAD